MKSLLQAMFRSLSAASVGATYRRGGASCLLVATSGRSEHDSYGNDGELLTARTSDWIVRTTDLVLSGVETLPQPGDEIDVNGRTYVVLPAGADRCYRFVDTFRELVRIHSVEK